MIVRRPFILPFISAAVIAVVCMTTAVSAQIPSILNSQGVIHNSGTLEIVGDAVIRQDTIGGRVEYTRIGSDSQLVAHLTYWDLHFSGTARKKLIDVTEPIRARNLFSTADSLTILDLVAPSWISAEYTVRHEGIVNPGQRFGRFLLDGTRRQDISGRGSLPIIELINDSGAIVTRGGGLRVVERFDLQRGRLDNTTLDNISMLDQAWIWRDDSGSIAVTPTGSRYHVRYYGESPQISGAEIPRGTTELGKLHQDNDSGLTLSSDAWVNDSLRLEGDIFTEATDSLRYKLFYVPSGTDPVFVTGDEEVNGTMVRTTLQPGRLHVMNNRRTSMRFANAQLQGPVRRVELRVKPRTIPLPTNIGIDKVQRFFQLGLQDAIGVPVPDSSYTLDFGYAWRVDRVDSITYGPFEETPGPLRNKLDSLALERFVIDKYAADGLSILPTNADPFFRYSIATNVRNGGDFAIGLASYSTVWVLRTKLILEGAMRQYGGDVTPIMATDLVASNILPLTPPPIYPYNLDPNRTTLTVAAMPDSIVDWIVVEFRTSPTDQSGHIQTGLLTSSGMIVDPTSFLPLPVRGIRPGEYHVAFLHRNHLAVMTEGRELIAPSNANRFVDMSNGANVFGGASAMKVLGLVGGTRLFGMVAGDVDQNASITRTDQNLIWTDVDTHGIYALYDTDLDGILSTRDWNLSWNNRGRTSVVP